MTLFGKPEFWALVIFIICAAILLSPYRRDRK